MYGHTIEYYSTVKRNEILTRVVTWLNLEHSVFRQTRKGQSYAFHSYEIPRVVRCVGIENRRWFQKLRGGSKSLIGEEFLLGLVGKV